MGMWGCTHKDNNYLLMAAESDGCLCNAITLLWQKLGSISMFERELEMLFFLNSPLLLFLIWWTLWFLRVCFRAFCQSFHFHGAELTREWSLFPSATASLCHFQSDQHKRFSFPIKCLSKCHSYRVMQTFCHRIQETTESLKMCSSITQEGLKEHRVHYFLKQTGCWCKISTLNLCTSENQSHL